MQTIQERILGTIENMIIAHKLECFVQHEFSNAGTIYIHYKGELVPFARVGYDFQSEAYTLRFWNGKVMDEFRQSYEKQSRFWEVFLTWLARSMEPQKEPR